MQSEQKRRMKPFSSLNTHDAVDDTMMEDNQQSCVSTFYSQFCSLNGPNALYWDEIRKDRSRFHRGEDNNFANIRPSILRSLETLPSGQCALHRGSHGAPEP